MGTSPRDACASTHSADDVQKQENEGEKEEKVGLLAGALDDVKKQGKEGGKEEEGRLACRRAR